MNVLLIALGRKTQRAIKKLVEKAHQFHLTINFDRATREALELQEFPEMSLVMAIAQHKSESATPWEARRSPILPEASGAVRSEAL